MVTLLLVTSIVYYTRITTHIILKVMPMLMYEKDKSMKSAKGDFVDGFCT